MSFLGQFKKRVLTVRVGRDLRTLSEINVLTGAFGAGVELRSRVIAV